MTRPLAALLACLALAATGCLGIPDEGPVVQTQSEVDAGEQLGYFNDPRPPTPGESPTDIVRHFLDAQAAIPIQTNTAAEFLTKDAAAAWRPRRTITYVDASLPVGSNQITVDLSGANQISPRGSWLGPLPPEAEQLTFSMRREEGEWRIDDVPDALIVPESWFSQAFRRVSLYFFDPTARILVPEPVYVPRGEPLATALVSGLLQGPVERRGRVARTFVPPGLEVDLSVTVTDDDVAEVALTGGTTVPTQQDADLMLAQLATTLGQDPTLAGFRVSIEGEPVTLDSGDTTFPMTLGDEHDPTGARATSLLYGLREGRLVAGRADDQEVVGGPMGASDLGVRSVGVNLGGTQVAGVARRGDRVLVTEVRDPDASVTEVASGASNLLPPVWDFADRLWLLDRTPSGARLAVVRGNRPHAVRIPGVSGRDVSHFLVSRDGSRLVAVVDGGTDDRVVVSRIEYDGRGRVRGGSRLRKIAWDDITRLSVTDIGWSSPTSVVVLHRLSGYLSQVRTMSVDGAPAGLTGISTTLQQRPRAVVSSPDSTEPVYVMSRAGLVDVLSGSRLVVADPETSFLTYAG